MPIRQTILLLLFAFSAFRVTAQTYFQKVYSFPYVQDFFADMEVLPDGRSAVLGRTQVKNDLNTRTLLMLLDTNGNIIWTKTLAVGKSNEGASLALSHDGNLLVGLDFSDANEQIRPVLLKISTDTGDILWETCFTTPGNLELSGITPLSDGGYVVVANRKEVPFLAIEGFSIIFKIDENGSVVWEKTLADSQQIFCWHAVENSSGDIYVMGKKQFTADNILIKLSPAGVIIWSKIEEDVYFQNMCIDEEDNIWFIGIGAVGDSSRLNRIEKLDADGNIIWAKLYDPNLPPWMDMAGIHPLAGGGILVTGHDALVGKSNTIIAKIGSSGEVQWAKKYAASNVNDYLLSVRSTAQGDIVAVGNTGAVFEDLDIWVVKTDLAGDIPDCCQTDFTLPSFDISPGINPFDLFTSSMLQPFSASTLIEPAVPTVSTICPMPFDDASDISPNAFTPNDDGVNDRFRPRFECPPLAVLFEVYDRWGKKVFETRDPESPGWDGTLDGKPAPSDVYVWRVEYEAVHNGTREKRTGSGDVALLR